MDGADFGEVVEALVPFGYQQKFGFEVGVDVVGDGAVFDRLGCEEVAVGFVAVLLDDIAFAVCHGDDIVAGVLEEVVSLVRVVVVRDGLVDVVEAVGEYHSIQGTESANPIAPMPMSRSGQPP